MLLYGVDSKFSKVEQAPRFTLALNTVFKHVYICMSCDAIFVYACCSYIILLVYKQLTAYIENT